MRRTIEGFMVKETKVSMGLLSAILNLDIRRLRSLYGCKDCNGDVAGREYFTPISGKRELAHVEAYCTGCGKTSPRYSSGTPMHVPLNEIGNFDIKRVGLGASSAFGR